MGYTYGVNRGGISEHPLYFVYFNMLARCDNKNRWNYKFYGGRGIKVCERWNGENGFKNFIDDMGERPVGYQLDRTDVNGDYEPSNCRWVSKYVQMGNTRNAGKNPGVSWHSLRNKWRARIKVKGRELHLGLFSNYEDAVKARQNAACTL